MEEAPDVVDNVSTSMGTVTQSGSMRDKIVWRKSPAMSPADPELYFNATTGSRCCLRRGLRIVT